MLLRLFCPLESSIMSENLDFKIPLHFSFKLYFPMASKGVKIMIFGNEISFLWDTISNICEYLQE